MHVWHYVFVGYSTVCMALGCFMLSPPPPLLPCTQSIYIHRWTNADGRTQRAKQAQKKRKERGSSEGARYIDTPRARARQCWSGGVGRGLGLALTRDHSQPRGALWYKTSGSSWCCSANVRVEESSADLHSQSAINLTSSVRTVRAHHVTSSPEAHRISKPGWM